MCKTIKQKVKFNAPPQTIYALLADSRKHSALTGRKASISKRIGGRFSINAGGVTGINVDLVPGKRIVQAWRNDRFPEGIFSMATFNLLPTPDGGTALVLTHRGVPKELIPGTERGWRDQYWNRIKVYLAAAASAFLLAASTTFAFQTTAPDLTGTWTGTFTSTTITGQTDEDPAHLVLKQIGTALTGTGGPTPDRQTPIKDGKVITIKDVTTVTFMVAERDGEVPAIHFDLKLVDGRLKGTAKAELNGKARTAAVDVGRAK